MGEAELEHERPRHLDHGEHAGEHVLVADAVVQDGRRHEHAHRRAGVVDEGRFEVERYPGSPQVGGHQPDGGQADDERRGAHNRASRPVVAHDQKHGGNDQREKD